MTREPQTLERITDANVTLEDGENVLIQSIDILGSGFMYTGDDLRSAE